ncbi:MFS transporter [Romboutsia ilealis]|uniref:Major facilitator super MFS 1 n=1 Tax=Romboutsia ilealis TaxID=1115758 RepID=A0A1V1I4D2_9FIRM|nr:MFS transporter [Romboutsia ilealis]CED94987.1 Major facilitator super MFS 1 [Romboutsia ilealis]
MQQATDVKTTNVKRNKRYFIVFICVLIQAIPYCIAQNLQSQMQTPVSQSGVVSEIGFTLLYFSGTLPALFNPAIAKVYDKLKIKYIYVLGLTIAGLGFASYGLAQNAIMFNASAICTQIGTILFTVLSLPIMMDHWFPGEGKGTALGIALAGGSLGNVFLQPVTVNLLANLGWRGTYIALGAAIIIIGVPLALLFIRFPKSDEVVVATSSNKSNGKPARAKFDGLSDKENDKNPIFWIFCAGCALMCFAVVSVSTQAIPVLGQKGFEPAKLGVAGSIFGVACLIGNVAGGKLFDKLGSFVPMVISGISTIAALLIMAFMPNGSAIGFLVPICSGLTVYTITSAPAFMPADVFGQKDGTMKMAKVGMSYALGCSISPLLFSTISSKIGLIASCILFIVVGVVGYGLNLYAQIQAKKMFAQK